MLTGLERFVRIVAERPVTIQSPGFETRTFAKSPSPYSPNSYMANRPNFRTSSPLSPSFSSNINSNVHSNAISNGNAAVSASSTVLNGSSKPAVNMATKPRPAPRKLTSSSSVTSEPEVSPTTTMPAPQVRCDACAAVVTRRARVENRKLVYNVEMSYSTRHAG